jgi:transcriptional regulator with XRE-family HTH domain
VGQQDGDGIASRIHAAMRSRGVQPRELVKRVSHRHRGTAYRIMSGHTPDPWTSTVVGVCQALNMDPDELLGTAPAPLSDEARQLYERALTLPERDKWILVDVVRTLRQRSH